MKACGKYTPEVNEGRYRNSDLEVELNSTPAEGAQAPTPPEESMVQEFGEQLKERKATLNYTQTELGLQVQTNQDLQKQPEEEIAKEEAQINSMDDAVKEDHGKTNLRLEKGEQLKELLRRETEASEAAQTENTTIRELEATVRKVNAQNEFLDAVNERLFNKLKDQFHARLVSGLFINQLKNEVQRKNEALEATSQQLKKVEAAYKCLYKRYGEQREINNANQVEKEAIQEQLQEQLQTINGLKEEVKKEIEEKEALKDVSKKELEEQQSKVTAITSLLNIKEVTFREAIHRCKARYDVVMKEKEKLKETVQNNQNESATQAWQIVQLFTNLVTAEEEKTSLVLEREELKALTSELNLKEVTFMNELERCKDRYNEVMKEKEELEETLQNDQNEMATQARQIMELFTNLVTSEEEKTSLVLEQEELKSALKNTEEQRQQTEDALTQLQTQYDQGKRRKWCWHR